MDSKLKQINGKDSVVFTLFDQPFLYSAGSASYYPITKCAKSLFLDDNFIKMGKIDENLFENFSEDEVKKTAGKVKEFYENDIIKPVAEHPAKNLCFGDYTLKLVSTLRCNLKCEYCFAEKMGKESDMSFATAKKAIDYFLFKFAPGNAVRYIIDLTGSGEPLLRLDWILKVNEYVLSLKKKHKINIFCQLACNGMLLTPKVSKILKENMILFGVSLDGPKRQSEYVRRGLNYDKVVENINAMENKDFFGLAATYSAKNHDLIEIFKSLYKLNPEVVGMKPVRATETSEMAITMQNLPEIKKSYDDFAKWMMKQVVNGNDEVFNKFIKSEDYFTRFLKIMIKPIRIYYRCSAGLSSIAVDANENILICPAFVGKNETKIGTLETGIETEKYEKLKSAYADKISYCKNCWARYACAGECFNVAYTNSLEITKPVEAMCELKKYLIELAIYFWTELRYEHPKVYAKWEGRVE